LLDFLVADAEKFLLKMANEAWWIAPCVAWDLSSGVASVIGLRTVSCAVGVPGFTFVTLGGCFSIGSGTIMADHE
jgi:hypothetical protein